MELEETVRAYENDNTLHEAGMREKESEVTPTSIASQQRASSGQVRNLWAKNTKLMNENAELTKGNARYQKECEELRHRLDVQRRKSEGLEKRISAERSSREDSTDQLQKLEEQLAEMSMVLSEQEQVANRS